MEKRSLGATSVTDNEVIAKIPTSNKEDVESGSGMVYVLSKETFTEKDGAGQYKSHEVVKPLLKVSVNFADYNELGGKIEWT